MKTLSFIIAVLVSTFLLPAQTLTVTVENVLNENGKVLFSLHTEETFMKGPGIKNIEAAIDGKVVTVTFEDVEPGIYAIMVLHDENENNRMDYELSGMPKEAYGASNNSMSFGPPQFSEAKFELKKENKEIKIRF
ncbi:MAG: DUF2141 domain-containing protein [Flavobacteriaceae bacterium]|nr:DUF2141 domain-containing protein [Bacteroidia bacterium]MBT8288041.1 DUF2141 domain-containing protein [Bacteroidia bacterium]NNF75853.1 DUF2141 domain-containing protein [Flavobacteriaceae bacterium]NNK71850.1 DUF2141 domain-containing protein [Flavobacteriaceae bacterium]